MVVLSAECIQVDRQSEANKIHGVINRNEKLLVENGQELSAIIKEIYIILNQS